MHFFYREALEEEAEFEVVGKLPVIHKEAEAKSDQMDNQSVAQAESHDQVSSTNGNEEVAGPSQGKDHVILESIQCRAKQ